MATLKLVFKDGLIKDFSDRYHEHMDKNGRFYTGNGWEVQVLENSVIATARRTYSSGENEYKVILTNNDLHSIYSINKKVQKERHKKIRFDGNGVLGLSGGNIASRYAYWRDSQFVDFLSENGIARILPLHDALTNYEGYTIINPHLTDDCNVLFSDVDLIKFYRMEKEFDTVEFSYKREQTIYVSYLINDLPSILWIDYTVYTDLKGMASIKEAIGKMYTIKNRSNRTNIPCLPTPPLRESERIFDVVDYNVEVRQFNIDSSLGEEIVYDGWYVYADKDWKCLYIHYKKNDIKIDIEVGEEMISYAKYLDGNVLAEKIIKKQCEFSGNCTITATSQGNIKIDCGCGEENVFNFID